MAPPSIASAGIPPTLPPSVEEAYRRKCIQLKQRLNEVEEANDVTRVRISRVERAVEKQRLERAFLLEQLAKRTSTNVEDSEGSPSPPSTPKEKPLRTKRGHRKPSFLTNLDQAPSFVSQGAGGTATLSPSGSDAFSHTHDGLSTHPPRRQLSNMSNGYPPASYIDHYPGPRPNSAYEMYSRDLGPRLIEQNRKAYNDGNFDVERALAEYWRSMPDSQRVDIQRMFERGREKNDDVEMGEEPEVEVGGFTAVNRG